MTAVGYDAARARGEAAVRVLRDVAVLIGEPADEPAELETGGEIVPGLGFGEDAEALTLRARDLDRGMFKIIILGEFKNGKSTLLNGMLGSAVLPAKAAPATAIITVLVYGNREDVAVYETNSPAPRTVSWEEFVREFQLSQQDQETLQDHGTVDRFRHVEYAQIECLHPICQNGVTFVDSPGLGEHISRTRVATNFLRQAQAVIFVLNATRILGQDERMFVENTLGQGRLEHVFFVVNRINQIDEESVEDIRDWVESGLRDHFLDAAGRFDRELYNRRVFFVDAKGALDARTQQPVDEERLATSGVPGLERELERFLTGDEKISAVLQSTVQLLRPLLERARRRVDQQKSALDQPLAELEARRRESEGRLSALGASKDEIERTIRLFGEVVQQKIYADLRSYVDEMQESWEEDSHQLIELDRAISIKNLLSSYAQREARDRMAAEIGEQVQRYLEIKFGQWVDRVPTVVRADVETMVAEVEAQVDDFQLQLEEIAAHFAGVQSSSDSFRPPASSEGLLQLALTLSEISHMTDSIMDPGDWTNVIGRMAQQAVVVLLVGTFVTGGNFLIAALIVEAIHVGMQESEIKRRIRVGLGERLHESLEKQVAEKRAFVQSAVEQRFRQFGASMTQAIQRQIDEVRAEQERIVRQKQDDRFSVDREKSRLDAVEEKLLELFGDLSEAAYGRRAAL